MSTGNTFPLAVYSTSRGLASGPTSWSVPSCSRLLATPPKCEICGLNAGRKFVDSAADDFFGGNA